MNDFTRQHLSYIVTALPHWDASERRALFCRLYFFLTNSWTFLALSLLWCWNTEHLYGWMKAIRRRLVLLHTTWNCLLVMANGILKCLRCLLINNITFTYINALDNIKVLDAGLAKVNYNSECDTLLSKSASNE